MADENFSTIENTGVQDAQSGQNQFVTFEQLEQFRKEVMDKSYANAQSISQKTANSSEARINSIIAEFKANNGVELNRKQAEQIAEQQQSNQPVQQNAQPKVDGNYQAFLYYHGFSRDSNIAKEMYSIQNSLGIKLLADDPEYKSYFGKEKRETYKNARDYVNAWRDALLDKTIRMRNMDKENVSQEQTPQTQTNIGQLPLVGSGGRKSNGYDPKRTAKSYIAEYKKKRNLP